jgi:hypothetical protein
MKYILDENGYYLGVTNHFNVSHTEIDAALPDLNDTQKAKWDGKTWIVEEDEKLVLYKKNKYQRDRAFDYPSWQTQMDLLYHGGIDALKAELKKTKDKYPKP